MKNTVWDRACLLSLDRIDPLGFYPGEIDRGVNFFVLALEDLGAKTEFSCEGHPNGFYVCFTAPHVLAVELQACGFFRTEVEGMNRWSLRLSHQESDSARQRCLRWAAEAWVKHFGDRLQFVKTLPLPKPTSRSKTRRVQSVNTPSPPP